MLKIAFCAGHYLGTAGKRIPRALDKNEAKEWVLNNRVADYFGLAATWYEGVTTYRTDDSTGKTFVDIPERVAQANNWGADLYIDIHHNAAGRVFHGGGVEVFSYPGSVKGKQYRDAIYAAVIAAGGLKGNRSNPLQEKKFDTLVLAKMPAVLIEYGYMDSTVDAPVILTDEYAQKVAFATMEAIAKLHGLKKKAFPDGPASLVEKVKETAATLKIAENGLWDTNTTRKLQQIFGTTVDGVISNQWAIYKSTNPGLTSGWNWIANPNGNGSQLIKAMQKWAGMSSQDQDGEIGPATIRAFQRKLGTTVDGTVSSPSQMVTALQKWANSEVKGK